MKKKTLKEELDSAQQRVKYLERRVDDLLAHAVAHNRQRRAIRKDAHDKAQRIAHLEDSIDNLHATLEEQLRRRKLCERERDHDRMRTVAIINGMRVRKPLSRLDMAWNDCCDDLRKVLEKGWDEETKLDRHCGPVYAVWETVPPHRRD